LVQAGRYLTGIDPLAVIGGPISESSPTLAGSSAARRLSVSDASFSPGGTAGVSVALEALGNENAIGFTLGFDPSAFTFSGIELGDSPTSAVFIPNLNQVGSGKVGIVLALANGNKFSAGMHDLVKVNLVATSAAGQFLATLTDQLVTRGVSDSQANELPVGFVNGNLIIASTNPPPTLSVSRSGGAVVLSWPVWAGDFSLQKADTIGGAPNEWTNTAGAFQTNGGDINFVVPGTNQASFFRLRR
jgi:hypothetical protein